MVSVSRIVTGCPRTFLNVSSIIMNPIWSAADVAVATGLGAPMRGGWAAAEGTCYGGAARACGGRVSVSRHLGMWGAVGGG